MMGLEMVLVKLSKSDPVSVVDGTIEESPQDRDARLSSDSTTTPKKSPESNLKTIVIESSIKRTKNIAVSAKEDLQK